MGNIKVKYVPSEYKGTIGYDGKKLFVTAWKKVMRWTKR